MSVYKNIGVIIPTRLGSSRLKKKSLIKVEGKALLAHLIDRLSRSKYIKRKNIIICTTKKNEDDLLVEEGDKNKVTVFRGDEKDIIKRYFDCAKKFGLDLIISVNGDNPLTSIEHLDITIEKAIYINVNEKFIVTQKNLPLGCSSYVFNINTLVKVYKNYMTKENDTGFIYFFTKTKLCKTLYIKEDKKISHFKNVRLTVDYAEDVEVMKLIFKKFIQKKYFSIYELLDFLKIYSSILKLNEHLDNKYWQRTKDKSNLQYKYNNKITNI